MKEALIINNYSKIYKNLIWYKIILMFINKIKT